MPFYFYFVLLIPCFCIFVWSLSVSRAEYGGYFWTARDVNPGHDENFLLYMAFIIVIFCGINAAWWRYLINAVFEAMAYAFLVWCSVSRLSVLGSMVLGVYKGKNHNSVCSSLPPFHLFFVKIYTATALIVLYFYNWRRIIR